MKIAISIIIASVLIVGAIVIAGQSGSQDVVIAVSNVSVVDGKQIVEIGVKGGYFPGVSSAKADMPTILRMKTQGSFDCSSAVLIPSIGYRANLPPAGKTDIVIPPQKSGAILQGSCAMGMYNFQIQFN